HPETYLLHRPPDLRPAYPHVFLHRSYVDRARDDGTQSHDSWNARRLGDRGPLDHLRSPNIPLDPLRLPTGVVSQHTQVFHRRFHLFLCPPARTGGNILHHPCNPIIMTKRILTHTLFLFLGTAVAFGAPQMIAFERSDAVWVANLEGSS